MATKYQVPVRELKDAETFSFADPASATGLAVFRLERRLSPSRRTLTERLTGRLYTMSAVTQVVHPLTELRKAREVVSAMAPGEPLTFVAEAQYFATNVASTVRVVTARARVTMAFEVAAAEPVETRSAHRFEAFTLPPSCWQSDYLGLPSQAGRDALKLASNLAAQHAAAALGMPAPDHIQGDEADAFNMGLWWLEHSLTGIPRKFRSRT